MDATIRYRHHDASPPLEATAPVREGQFAELYGEFAPRVRGLVRRRILDDEVAEDIVQETLFRAYRHRLHTEDGDEQWRWLATVARNLCLDERKRLRRRPERRLDDAASLSLSVPGEQEQLPAEMHAREALVRAIAELPDRERRVFVERRLAGRSYDEIATAEGWSRDAVKALSRRARRRAFERFLVLADAPPGTAPHSVGADA